MVEIIAYALLGLCSFVPIVVGLAAIQDYIGQRFLKIPPVCNLSLWDFVLFAACLASGLFAVISASQAIQEVIQ